MDNQTYQQIIGEIGTLITIFAPLLTSYKIALALGFDKYIDSKIGLIKDEKLRKVAENIKNRVEDLAVNTITMLEAVEKPIIVENIKNGLMTKSDLLNLKTKAIDTIKGQLTTEGQTDLQNTVGDVNTYLETLIEAKLADLKVDNTSSVSKTEISMPTSEELDNETLRNQLAQSQSQLQQVQLDKDNLSQQLSEVQEAKRQSEQSWQDLANQVSSLSTENQNLKAKLDSITQVVQPIVTQPVAENSNATVDTTAQAQSTDGQTIAQ